MPTLNTYFDIARTLHGERSVGATSRRLLFVWRSLMAAPESGEWYEQLSSGPFARAALENPSLYRKIVRPYLTWRTTDREKLRILREHCRLLSEVLAPDAIVRAFSGEGIPLAAITGRGDRGFSVRLLSDGKYRKEGEHSVVLVDTESGMRVSTMTFVTDRMDGQRTLFIGGMQGLSKGAPKSIITDATKALNGMRPKALLLFGLRCVAECWEVQRLMATGNAIHVSRHRDYALNRIRRPRLTYDSFWLECGGRMRDDGFIDVPLEQPIRDDQHIPVGKRSAYHRRYAMLDDLSRDISASLKDLRPGG
jgi:uncharacterized protein